jgi:outer membrane biosynthesis protein TonB
MNSTQHSFTAKDLIRYVRGEMTPAEQHALEKAALDDPFLSDALDGYMAHPQEEETMLALRGLLKSHQPSTKPSSRIIWFMRPLSIAAAIAVLFFAGYVALQSDQTDTTKTQEPLLAENKQPKVNTETVTPTQENPPKSTLANTSTQPIKTAEVLPSKNQQPVVAKAVEAIAFNAPVVSDDVQVEANESPALESDMAVTLPSTTTDATKSLTNAGEAKDEVFSKMESVKLTAAATMSKKSSTRSKTPVSVKQMQSSGINADDQAFQTYLAKQSNRICAGTNGEAWHGEIVLSFTVNRKSRPTDIRVESAPDKACVESSIEILKRGPDWDKSIDGRRTVRINW